MLKNIQEMDEKTSVSSIITCAVGSVSVIDKSPFAKSCRIATGKKMYIAYVNK